VYGVVGLKTHAKMLLVTRREGKPCKRYGHLSTGNYNPRTARLYTDVSYLTATRADADVEHLFVHLASQSASAQAEPAAAGAVRIAHESSCAKIEALAPCGCAGNRHASSQDERADRRGADPGAGAPGSQGVKIDLIVRGACMLPPGCRA
jgi:polyphosphate kinase